MTKQSDIEMVAKARAWAVKAHAGQKDKAGKDYQTKAGKAHDFNCGRCQPCHNKKSRPHIRGGFLFWRVFRPKK